ncbi:hybrid sensor histidine kinase/response regulator [Vulcaniibacterium tengchongense]|uniref:histidine kinase n=1 Tax=Vulcaniibacterium tengchongense TaxID=1273429 RepID=A0A3N4V362_9GAMM|nr:ATP-binding protein [Vulcaniibacterium tengchongense]RPE76918.1 PAS domain S-box-containing protein [Vulcaniibacterium tengchongense]
MIRRSPLLLRLRDLALALPLAYAALALHAHYGRAGALPTSAGYLAVIAASLLLGLRAGLLTVAALSLGAMLRAPHPGPSELALFALLGAALAWLVADVGERRRSEKRRRADLIEQRLRAETEQRALLDHLPKMVWIAEPDGSIRYHNRFWYEYTGLSGREDWRAIVHPDDLQRGLSAWKQAMERAEPLNVELRFRRGADDAYRWHVVKGVPIADETGRVRCWYGASTDIEDQKRALETLAAANERISRFLAVLSHELRNPLAGIASACALMNRADADQTQRRQALATIARQGQHLRRMVDDLLDISRVTQGKVELRRGPVELVRLLAEVLQDNRAAAGHAGVRLEPLPALPPCWVDGDRARLRQVFDNLVSNAIKAGGAGQRVRVELARDGNEAVVWVIDQGQGFDDDQRRRIFEPFVQSAGWQSRGLGLGLSIVQSIVELHRGRVSAHSDGPGKGARFAVRLPLALAPPAPHEADGPLRRATRSASVLIVEDEADIAESLRTLLALEGYDVAVAEDADAALSASRARPFDVVLCDLELHESQPGQRSGYLVASALQELVRPPYLIAYSGYGQAADREQSALAGFQAHLVKPATLEEIVAAIEEGLQQRRRPVDARQGAPLAAG